jgi:hypothetical protein
MQTADQELAALGAMRAGDAVAGRSPRSVEGEGADDCRWFC